MTLPTLILLLIALVTLGATAIALTLRNIIRSVLLLVVGWVGIAAFYLWAGAEFVAFAQILVYVGAISMIVLFGVVLTRRTPVSVSDTTVSPLMRALLGASTGTLVVIAILWGILATPFSQTTPAATAASALTMQTLGLELMGQYAAALLIVGALLTLALLGAVILAAQEKETPNPEIPNPK